MIGEPTKRISVAERAAQGARRLCLGGSPAQYGHSRGYVVGGRGGETYPK